MITNLKTMKSMSRYTRMAAAAVMMTILAITAKAESTLTIFFPGYANLTYTLTINGEEIDGMDMPVKKVMDGTNGSVPSIVLHKAYKQIRFSEEGKFLVLVKIDFTNGTNGKVSTYQIEYPVIAEDGDELFAEVKMKGLTDMQMKEIDSKSAKKNLDSGKYKRMSEAKYPVK